MFQCFMPHRHTLDKYIFYGEDDLLICKKTKKNNNKQEHSAKKDSEPLTSIRSK